MPVIRFRSKQEFQEWKNVIEHFESIVIMANQENKQLRQFCETQLKTAQFWNRYAMERTNDTKLRDIAQNSLKQVETEVRVAETTVPTFLAKMLTFLKQFQSGS
jgi:flagellar motility protein MotE (MotC chaperone)